MPTRRYNRVAGLKFGKRLALCAAVTALSIGAAAPPASALITSAGQLYAFGDNRYGELGTTTNSGTFEPNPTPTLVTLPGASGPVTQVAAGYEHSLALTSTGQLYAFGSNRYGQLGTPSNSGTFEPNPTPVLITLPGASGPVTQIATGRYHSLALTSTGQLYAFGLNEDGQLGIEANSGTEEPNPTPTLVTLPGASGPVTQIAAGARHSLAVTSSGELFAFGSNYYGQLGLETNSGTGVPNPTPARITLPGASGPVTQVAAGADHSLALTSTGQLYAFGENEYGQLGSATNNGTESPNQTPTILTLPTREPVTQVTGGYSHSLALGSSGELYAFGSNYYGQLGNTIRVGFFNANPFPALVTLGRVVQIAAGSSYSLAVTSSGQLYAFGWNRYGQLGSATNNGTEEPNPTPTPVDLGTGTTIDTVALGPWSDHTLVVVADLAVTSDSLPAGRVGAPYSTTAMGQGGTAPYSWQARGLPAGLNIDPASGQIRGTPTGVGTTQVTLSVSDRFGVLAQGAPLTLQIESAARKAARPTISRLRQSHARWREGGGRAKVSSAVGRSGTGAPLGTIFTFKLNTKATVKFAFAPRKRGRRSKRSAVASLSFTGRPGTNRVAFQGDISRSETLKPGSYKLTATASAEGSRSKPRSLSFTVVR